MQEQLARLGSDEAKAEAIQTRQVEVLESQRYVDPIRYMTFMERINKTLQDYLKTYNYEISTVVTDCLAGKKTVEQVFITDGGVIS